jgi:hypothetical protein
MLISAITKHLDHLGANRVAAGIRRAARRREAVADRDVDTGELSLVHTRLEPIGALEQIAPMHYDSAIPAPTITETYRVVRQPGAVTVSLTPDGPEPAEVAYELSAGHVSDQDGYEAAIRYQVGCGESWGPTVQRVVRYRKPDARHGLDEVQAIVRGRLSDVLAALPDEATRQTWADAGVMGLMHGRHLVRMETI